MIKTNTSKGYPLVYADVDPRERIGFAERFIMGVFLVEVRGNPMARIIIDRCAN